MSDITKLITLGVISKDIELAGMKIKLVTPTVEGLKEGGVGDIIAQFVVDVDGKSYVGEQDKKALAAVISQMQSGVAAKLMEICTGMLEEQSNIIDGFFSKKA